VLICYAQKATYHQHVLKEAILDEELKVGFAKTK